MVLRKKLSWGVVPKKWGINVEETKARAVCRSSKSVNEMLFLEVKLQVRIIMKFDEDLMAKRRQSWDPSSEFPVLVLCPQPFSFGHIVLPGQDGLAVDDQFPSAPLPTTNT